MLCLGSTIAILVAGRLLQGASSAVIGTIGLALLADTVGHEGIGQAVGWVSLSMSLAILVAPLMGGVVYARAGYYAVYYMAFGLIVIDILLRLLLIEKKTATQWHRSDEQSQDTNEVMPWPQNPQTAATDLSEKQGVSPKIISPPLPTKKRLKVPLVLSLLSSYRLLSAIWCTFAISLLLTSWDAVLPLRVYHLFRWGSLGRCCRVHCCRFRTILRDVTCLRESFAQETYLTVHYLVESGRADPKSTIGAGLIFLPLLLPSFLAPLVGRYSDVSTFLGDFFPFWY